VFAVAAAAAAGMMPLLATPTALAGTSPMAAEAAALTAADNWFQE
jgi:hypothetical protein